MFGRRAEANKPFVWISGSELIPSGLSMCRQNQQQENAMIYRRTSDILSENYHGDGGNRTIWEEKSTITTITTTTITTKATTKTTITKMKTHHSLSISKRNN